MIIPDDLEDVVTLDGFPDLLNAKQVQEVLGLGRSMIYSLLRNGEIRHMKIHGKIRIPRRYLVEYINKMWYSENNTTDAGKSSVIKEVAQ